MVQWLRLLDAFAEDQSLKEKKKSGKNILFGGTVVLMVFVV